MRSLFAAVLCAATVLVASAANAESPPPIGYWVTADGSERFLIEQNAQCSFQVPASGYAVGGPCSWNASNAGGILTVMNSIGQYQAAPIYYNVIWVDDHTIKIEGDTFYRQQ